VIAVLVIDLVDAGELGRGRPIRGALVDAGELGRGGEIAAALVDELKVRELVVNQAKCSLVGAAAGPPPCSAARSSNLVGELRPRLAVAGGEQTTTAAIAAIAHRAEARRCDTAAVAELKLDRRADRCS
jgi:hypothetical protein